LLHHSVRRNLVSLILLFLSAAAVVAQEAPENQPADTSGITRLNITLDARGAASVALKVFDRDISSSLVPAIEQMLQCPLENAKERAADGDWVASAHCAQAFRKKGLLVGGTIGLMPLAAQLKRANVLRIEATIRHPRTGFSRLVENGWTLRTTPQFVEYSRTLSPSDETPPVHLAFGYRVVNFLPVSLLLFPVSLTLIMRWAALRIKNADPAVVWFTYWRVFGWVMTGAWLLWVQGSNVLDCAALARFLLNDSSKAPLLQVAFYLVPPILVQLICTLTSGAVLRRVGGEQWALPVTVKHAFWHEPVNIWPLLCLLAGVASLLLFNAFVLGFACLAVGYASRVALLKLWQRFQNLSRYELPAGELREQILALARQAGVSLKQIYLLPASEGRLASPLMSRQGRLLLSDYLLRLLPKRELNAVLARELSHVKRHHPAFMLGATVVALPLIYRFSNLPVIAGQLPWAVRGPLLVWLTPLFLYLLWRRFERDAEAAAVAITGDSDAMLSALPKIAQCNLIGNYFRRLEWRFWPNGLWRERPASEVLTAPSGGQLVSTGNDASRAMGD
jgi:Zn-dependent protease with chaperone function